jgi:hypothetical protein
MMGVCKVITVEEHPKYLEIVFKMIFLGLFGRFRRRNNAFIN